MYNCVVKRFLDTEEVQYYPTVIPENRDSSILVREWHKFNSFTGEIYPLNVNTMYEGKRFYDYFLEDYSFYRTMRDNDEVNLKRTSRRAMNKIKDIAYSNKWDWFLTLTFNPEIVDSFDYECVVSKMSVWLNNMKKVSKNMKYIVVPELHESGRIHLHGLFANCDGLEFVDSGKRKDDMIVYNVGKFKFGWSTATEIKDTSRASTYISKYITKDVVQFAYNKRRYWYSKNCDLPTYEKYLTEYVKVKGALTDVMHESESDTPTGKVRYYRCRIYTTNTTNL